MKPSSTTWPIVGLLIFLLISLCVLGISEMDPFWTADKVNYYTKTESNNRYVPYNGATDDVNLTIGQAGDGSSLTVNGDVSVNEGSLYVSNNITTSEIVNISNGETTVAGSSDGNAYFTMPFQGDSYKKVIVYMEALEGTATYTFPTSFRDTPLFTFGVGLSMSSNINSASGTSVTVQSANPFTPATGFIIIEGN